MIRSLNCPRLHKPKGLNYKLRIRSKRIGLSRPYLHIPTEELAAEEQACAFDALLPMS